MFSSDRNIETISQLIVEIKRYVELRAECLQIDIVSKMSRLFTAIILFVVLFMLSALAVMFMSMTAAAAFQPHTCLKIKISYAQIQTLPV